jgi:multidrug resistance efflux pump
VTALTVTVDQIVSAGQCLLPLDPRPSQAEIVRVVKRIATGFELSREIERQAIARWFAKVRYE